MRALENIYVNARKIFGYLVRFRAKAVKILAP